MPVMADVRSALSQYRQALRGVKTQYDDCIEQCKDQLKMQLDQCTQLPQNDQAACRASALSVYQGCVQRCQMIRNAALQACDAQFLLAIAQINPN